MNADPEVMEHFPSTLSRGESDALVDRIEAGFERDGFGLWALELRGDGSFMGFTGLSVPNFEAPFTPAVEVGWRLARWAWGNGYATEAAAAALDFGFSHAGPHEIVSFTSFQNVWAWRATPLTTSNILESPWATRSGRTCSFASVVNGGWNAERCPVRERSSVEEAADPVRCHRRIPVWTSKSDRRLQNDGRTWLSLSVGAAPIPCGAGVNDSSAPMPRAPHLPNKRRTTARHCVEKSVAPPFRPASLHTSTGGQLAGPEWDLGTRSPGSETTDRSAGSSTMPTRERGG